MQKNANKSTSRRCNQKKADQSVMQPKVQVQEFQEKAAAPARPREPPALRTHHIIIWREFWVVSLQNCPLDFRRLCQVATTYRYEMQIDARGCKQINFKALQSKKADQDIMQPKAQVQEFQEQAAAAQPREPPALCTHHIGREFWVISLQNCPYENLEAVCQYLQRPFLGNAGYSLQKYWSRDSGL